MAAEGTSCSEKVGVDLDFSRGKGLGKGSSDNVRIGWYATSSVEVYLADWCQRRVELGHQLCAQCREDLLLSIAHGVDALCLYRELVSDPLSLGRAAIGYQYH